MQQEQTGSIRGRFFAVILSVSVRISFSERCGHSNTGGKNTAKRTFYFIESRHFVKLILDLI